MATANPSLRELFETALDMPPDQRARFLDVHSIDGEQRERLTRMLAAVSDPTGPLPDTPAAALADALNGEGVVRTFPPGTRIGPFELVEVLGEGGSSTVFRASRTTDGVRQEVALKLLRRALYSPESERQFRRERLALGQLRHPGIARLIEGGVTETGLAYIALELVDGVSITDYARDHRLDTRARLLLFLDVCRAVDAAHRALIVHRDLKPSNVLITAEREVKLLDFGIAKLLAAEDDTQTRLPSFTPAYASPEQRSGGLVTTATDVFGLGVLLGELMTGERLSDTSVNSPSSHVSDHHAIGVLPAEPAVTRRELRGDLDNIVLKALDAEPAKRYASAGMLAEDIERLLDGRPVAAHPPSAGYRARKFIGRHRGAVAATGVFAIAVLAALGIALWQASVARQQAEVAREQARRAEATRQFLTGVFQQADPDANGGRPISAHELLEKGAAQIGKGTYDRAAEADAAALLAYLFVRISDFDSARALLQRALPVGEDPAAPRDIRARVLIGIAGVEWEGDAYDAAIAHARQGLTVLDDSMPAAADLGAQAHQLIAHGLIAKGDWTGANALLTDTLARDTAALGRGTDSLIEEWLAKGEVLDNAGKFDESTIAFKRAIAMAREVFGENSNREAHALNEYSNMLTDKSDFAGTERALRQALEIRRRTMGPTARDTLIEEGNLLTVIETEGRLAEALPQRLQLIDTATHTAQLHPSDLALFYAHAGMDLRELGRFDEAEAMLRKGITQFDAALGPDNTQSVGTLRTLAATLILEGRYRDARIPLEHALDILQKRGPAPIAMADTQILLGRLLRLEHRPDEALTQLQAAADAYLHADAHDWGRPLALAGLSEAQLDAGDAEAARGTAQTAVTQMRTLLSPQNPLLSGPLFALARAELALGHAAQAEPLLAEALALRKLYPEDDPRVLEVKVAEVAALGALGRADEARASRAAIEPALKASSSPYAADLRAQLETNGAIAAHAANR